MNSDSNFLAALMAAAFLPIAAVAGDPRTDQWYVTQSGKYARIYTDAAAKTAGSAVTTWSNGTQTQSLPAYSGVQEVYSSDSWVYLRTTGLGVHVMGPWSTGFPNLPQNRKILYRIPRTPSVPATPSLTGLGSIGYFVDGVAMFDSRDGFVWTGTTESGGAGTGYWNREAYVNEGATFDPAYAHQEQQGTYHYHANPIALRYLLGDHVDFNATTRTYAESTPPVTRHSPILGWVADGFPVYGPYGYAVATNPASGLRRMISGFQLRNGQKGTDNLTTAGRASIPAWATRLYGTSGTQTGPAVSTSYPLGRYMEDNAFLGDLGYKQGVDFDLDESNGRFCVTPEFPNGTYAYFVSIAADGTPVYPYNIGRSYHGTPSGGNVTSIPETVITNFVGGPSRPIVFGSPVVKSGEVSLVNFDPVTGTANTGGGGGGGGGGTQGPPLASISPISGSRGTTVTVTMTLGQNPPPTAVNPSSAALGTIAGSNVRRSGNLVTASFAIPSNASTGVVTASVTFPGPPGSGDVTFALQNGFAIK